MKQLGSTDRSPFDDMWMKSGWGISILCFVCFTMSSRFSAHGYDDDDSLSSHRSLVDLSPSSRTPRSRARSGSLGAEDPTIPGNAQRSSIRINTELTVRIISISGSCFIDMWRPTCLFSPHAENRPCWVRQPRPSCGDRPTHVLLPSRHP